MKKLLLITALTLSGCAAKAVEQQVAMQQQALFMVGAKLLELEAMLKPEKAKQINEALAKGEIQIDPPSIASVEDKKK